MTADQKVLVAYDGSEGADAAIDAAVRLFPGCSLLVLSVGHSLASVASAGVAGIPAGVAGEAAARMDEAAQQETEALAEAGAQRARDQDAEATPVATLCDGAVWATIVHVAEQNEVEAIVIGSRGRSNVKSILLGSVSNAVVHHAGRPALVVPGPSAGSDGPGAQA